MQTIKFVYSGSATRKLTVMGRDQVIVSGDNNSTQFIFTFPDYYSTYSKEIIWSGFYLEDPDGEPYVPRYPIVNDTFYVPQEITLPNAGSEISFQVILTKPQNESDPTSFDIIETSLEVQVYISKSARYEQIEGSSSDILSELLQKAYVSSAYDVDQEEDRPVITFYNTSGAPLQPTLILNTPYLDQNGKVSSQFLPPGTSVRVIPVDNYSDLEDTSQNVPDLAIIQHGTGTPEDYTGNIYVKIADNPSAWTIIYSKYTDDEVGQLSTDVAELDSAVDGLSDTVSGLGDSISQIESDVSSLTGRVDDVESDISTLSTDIQSQESDIAQLQTDVGAINTEIGSDSTQGSILGRIKGVEDRTATAETNIQNLQDDVRGVENEIGTESTQDTILYRVKQNEGNISSLNTAVQSKADKSTVQQIDGRLSTAENKLSTIAEGAEVNVQADWNVTDTASDQYIQHKPTLGTQAQLDYTQTSQGAQDQGKAVALNNTGVIDNTMLPTYVQSVNGRSGVVTITKSDVGLTNTEDGAKQPVTNLTSTTNPPTASTVGSAINGKMNALNAVTGGKILVSKSGDSDDIQESAYTTDKLQYLQDVNQNIQDQLDQKVESNGDVGGGTYTKITYDQQGLVIGGTLLEQSDIPDLQASKITSGRFDESRVPESTGIMSSEIITCDGLESSWTLPFPPNVTQNIVFIKVLDEDGYEVRFGNYTSQNGITLYTSEPPEQGATFRVDIISPAGWFGNAGGGGTVL